MIQSVSTLTVQIWEKSSGLVRENFIEEYERLGKNLNRRPKGRTSKKGRGDSISKKVLTGTEEGEVLVSQGGLISSEDHEFVWALVSGFFHLVQCYQGSAILCHVLVLNFFLWLNNMYLIVGMYHILFIQMVDIWLFPPLAVKIMLS